jgi:hypothetical protein
MSDFTEYFSNLGPLELIGVAGFLVYMLSFACVQLNAMDGNGVLYSLSNVLAASLVAISLIAEFNLSSALIQGSWIIFGLCGVMLRLRFRSRKVSRSVADFKSGGMA